MEVVNWRAKGHEERESLGDRMSFYPSLCAYVLKYKPIRCVQSRLLRCFNVQAENKNEESVPDLFRAESQLFKSNKPEETHIIQLELKH